MLWTTAAIQPQQGVYVVASGDIDHSQRSDLELSVSIPVAGEISFWRRVSSEASFDYLRFYIDDDLTDSWSGILPWGMRSYLVDPGDHVFRWSYFKDASTDAGNDQVYLDEISIHVAP